MGLQHQLDVVDMFRRFGVYVTLSITSAEVETLSVDDVAALRALGAGDPVFKQLRTLARQPGRHLEIDFERQVVIVVAAAE